MFFHIFLVCTLLIIIYVLLYNKNAKLNKYFRYALVLFLVLIGMILIARLLQVSGFLPAVVKFIQSIYTKVITFLML